MNLDSKIDIYSYNSIQELKEQQHERGCDCFVAVVEEGEHTYAFDAYSFLQDGHHGRNFNPLTRRVIEVFRIYIATPEDPTFSLYGEFDKNDRMACDVEAVPLNVKLCPIFWNNLALPIKSRMRHLEVYATETSPTWETAPSKAIDAFKYLFSLGLYEFSEQLSNIFLEKKEYENFHYWAEQRMIRFPEVRVHCVLFLGVVYHDDLKDRKTAFPFYLEAATRYNYWAICNVIRFLEEDIDTNLFFENDELEIQATHWRGELPEQWQKKPMEEFACYLKKINYQTQEGKDSFFDIENKHLTEASE